MKKLVEYKYTLKTKSKLVLSPREHSCFYQAAGDFDKNVNNGNVCDISKVNIIYPFYQYGSYDGYNPLNTDYYIPGSSIKGAIHGVEKNIKLMVDDLPVKREQIRLNTLMKIQYINHNINDGQVDGKQPNKATAFFPNVAVEMVDVNTEISGKLFCEVNPEKFLNEAQSRLLKRLCALNEKIKEIRKLPENTEHDKKVLSLLCGNIDEKVMQIKKRNSQSLVYTTVFGGYKGLILSGVFREREDNGASKQMKDLKSLKESIFFDLFEPETNPGAIYYDEINMLPYGLVELDFRQQ